LIHKPARFFLAQQIVAQVGGHYWGGLRSRAQDFARWLENHIPFASPS
jgi:hypothetical protein